MTPTTSRIKTTHGSKATCGHNSRTRTPLHIAAAALNRLRQRLQPRKDTQQRQRHHPDTVSALNREDRQRQRLHAAASSTPTSAPSARKDTRQRQRHHPDTVSAFNHRRTHRNVSAINPDSADHTRQGDTTTMGATPRGVPHSA